MESQVISSFPANVPAREKGFNVFSQFTKILHFLLHYLPQRWEMKLHKSLNLMKIDISC